MPGVRRRVADTTLRDALGSIKPGSVRPSQRPQRQDRHDGDWPVEVRVPRDREGTFELYGTDVSHELISKATEGVLELFRQWRSRPLCPIVYLDALFVSTRDAGQVTKRAFYIALGVSALTAISDGNRLRGRSRMPAGARGCYGAPEGAEFWLTIVTTLKNRGVEDISSARCEGRDALASE